MMHGFELLLAARPFHADFAQRPLQPLHMGSVVNEPALNHRSYLIDAIRKQEAAVKYRNFPLFFRYIAPVNINDTAH